MAGAGTDKTKRWIATEGPVVILVEPQLGDNVGAAARAMANFGLSRLRLVKPRDGWPNPRAWVAASGAGRVLDEATLHDTVEAAIADLTFVRATTAREQLLAFFENLERELEKVEFFRPAEKHETMSINLRNIFHRMAPSRQDIQTLSGVIMAIAEGRKGPAKGGVLDGAEAEMLRAL